MAVPPIRVMGSPCISFQGTNAHVPGAWHASPLGSVGSLWCKPCRTQLDSELAGSAEKGLGTGRPAVLGACGHRVLGVNSQTAGSETGPNAQCDTFQDANATGSKAGGSWQTDRSVSVFPLRLAGWGQHLKSCHCSLRPPSLPPSASSDPLGHCLFKSGGVNPAGCPSCQCAP